MGGGSSVFIAMTRWGAGITLGTPRMTNEMLPERSIPDRSPGHAFIAIADPGWRRRTKV